MSLRFFADHCVSNAIVESIRSWGHEVFVLRDHLPTDSPDPVVIAKAQDLDAILISLNGDFADIVGYPPARYGGIISLQIRNHPEVTTQVLAQLHTYLRSQREQVEYAD